MSSSKTLLQQALDVIPGGVNSPVRAFRAVGGDPPFIARGEGTWIYDVDGHEYVDLVSSWGALLHGHAHPRVVAAVTSAASRGSSYGAPTEAEVRLAEQICARVPSVERVRLCNSGTEATMHAIRLARGFTGRDLILKMDGNYHGAHDAVLVQAGSGLATLAIPGSPGVPEGTAAATLVAPYNDLTAVEEVFAAHGDRIAAVILEPVCGNMGCILPLPGFLEGLRSITQKHGSVLIFDEVMTGFRLAAGGAQERFGITPDLTCMGKVVGGGFPMAAFGGRADIMAYLAPEGPVYQAGTLSGNPVAVAAGLATLELLNDGVYAQLEESGRRIEETLAPSLAYHGLSFARIGSMFTVFFREQAPTNFAEARECDLEAFGRYFSAALNGGVYLPPSQFEAAFFTAQLKGRALELATDGMSSAIVAALA
ncbi:MAG: glutamate-1-semialdehyde 2,1-aminomutase [Myxococcota bacterium]